MPPFWCTSWSPFGALHSRQGRTEVDQSRKAKDGRMREVDQPVTTFRYDEALVKIASHQGFLSG